jgi:hypothetical protein
MLEAQHAAFNQTNFAFVGRSPAWDDDVVADFCRQSPFAHCFAAEAEQSVISR